MDSTLACLAQWMPHQRWYTGKGRTPSLRLVGSWDQPSDSADARMRTLLVADDASEPPVLYQVPVVQRPTASVDASDENVIGSSEPGVTLVDGPYDAAYADALFRLVTEGGEIRGAGTVASGTAAASAPPTVDHPQARVLSGEQSNTSLIYRATGGTPVICKVFRQVHPGLNPDIELQTALADAGSPYVPRAVGWVDGEWPGSASDSVAGSLAFAQEFLSGVEDAWRVALAAASAGEDFAGRARDLGIATAEVHRSLAELFPTDIPNGDRRAAIVESWRGRLATAIAEVPGLASHRDDVEAAYARALDADWPRLQRIHGDYHLGQVILVPGRGWVLLDFEGEPLRPMSERTAPDLALRDVAGMLRSFDYVAGSIERDESTACTQPVQDWAGEARAAFLAGYENAAGMSASGPLLDALELDKAVYEAIYEARNRPTWLPIPMDAVERLSAPT